MTLLLQYTLIFASVLILVALGGCFAEHSGVINLGLEGIMIMGALGGALTMRYLPSDAPAIVIILSVILVAAVWRCSMSAPTGSRACRASSSCRSSRPSRPTATPSPTSPASAAV